MASGKTSVTVTGNHKLWFEWKQSSQSISGNYSVVTWKMWLAADAYGAFSYSGSHSWSVTVNGQNYSGNANWSVAADSTKELASGTTTIYHNSDGSKTFSFSFSQTFNFTWGKVYRGTYSGDGSGTLDKIARNATLSAGNGTLGVQQTLTVSGASGLTYKVTYTCGNETGNVTTGTTSTTIYWTPPMDLAHQNTAGTTLTCKLKLTTMSGGTTVGTSEVQVALTIPASVAPTVTFTYSDETGTADRYGYLKGLSQLRIKITAAGTYGSTITANTATVDRKTYTGDDILTQVIASSGNVTIVVKTTDTRGRTASASKTISVAEYAAPKISGVNVYRSDANGTASSTGEYMTVVFSAEIYPLNNANTAAYSVQRKKTTEAGYAETILQSVAGRYSVSSATFVFVADKTASYDVIVTAQDAFTTVKKAAVGAAVGKLFSILAKGMGLALGKIAELQNTFDIAFKTRLNGGLVYPTLPPGTDLDDVRTPNWYASRDASTSAYGNSPVTSGTFLLEVKSCGASGQLVQRITADDGTAGHPKTKMRFFNGQYWGNWLHINDGETVLFDDEAGNSDTIYLSVPFDKMQYLDIYFCDNMGKTGGFTRVYNPAGKTICLSIVESAGGAYLRYAKYEANGTELTPTGYGYTYIGSGTPVANGGKLIKITRLICYE